MIRKFSGGIQISPAVAWNARRRSLSDAERSGIFEMPIHPLTIQTQIVSLLIRLGHQTRPPLQEEKRLEFRRNLGTFLRAPDFNRKSVRVAAGPIVADLSGDVSGQYLDDEYINALMTYHD